jgi:hypothetical protein
MMSTYPPFKRSELERIAVFQQVTGLARSVTELAELSFALQSKKIVRQGKV